MKIVFWSPTPFSGRKTSNLLLMALQAAKEGGEQLVLHADAVGSGPEHFLLSGRNRNRMVEQREFGIELLDNMLRCERFDKEIVVNSAYSFAGGKLHILPSGSKFFYQGREENAAETIAGVMQRASKEFQNVWVEIPAGESVFTERLFTEADLVVINFSQSPCEITKIVPYANTGKEFFVMGAYERRCTYTKHNLMLLYPNLQGKSAVIPYQVRYLEACCAGTVEAFWERGDKQGEEEVLYPFFHEVRRAYQELKRYGTEWNDKKSKKEEKGIADGV